MDDTEWGDFEGSGSLHHGVPSGYGAAPGQGPMDHVPVENTSMGSAFAQYDGDTAHFSNTGVYSDFVMESPIGYHGYEQTQQSAVPRSHAVMNPSRTHTNSNYSQIPSQQQTYGAPFYGSAPQNSSAYAAHRAAATMQRPMETPYQVSPELIEYEVSKSISQLNHCLALLATFHASQRAAPEGRIFSDQLLLAHEIHAARRELIGWTSRFNREISGAFHSNHHEYQDSHNQQPPRSAGRLLPMPASQQRINPSFGQAPESQRQSVSSASSTRSEPSSSPVSANHPSMPQYQTTRRLSTAPQYLGGYQQQAFDQDPLGTSSAPSDEDPDDTSLSPRASSVVASPVRLPNANTQSLKMQIMPSKSAAVAAVVQEVEMPPVKSEVIEDRAKRSRKRTAPEESSGGSSKRRALPLVEKMSKAGTVMQFKVNPSPSVPLSVSGPSSKGVKIPSALANTAASGMMYSFNFRKETKKAAAEAAAEQLLSAAAGAPRKPSSLGSDLPAGPVSLSDFEHLGVLGTGTFGKVKLCMHKSTRQYFCLKILRKQIIYRYHQLNHVQNEKIVLQQVKHPGVVRLFSTFNDSENLYLLIEYAPGGELFTLIRKFGKFPDDVARFYASEIIVILEYLHSKNIVYRDLKPENILLDPTGHVKLADFGFAKQIVDRTWTMCGTPDYMAPELIAMSGHGVAVDYWSLGVLVFEMLVGYPPFTDSTTMGLFAKIREPTKLVIPDHVSSEARNFIRSLLVVDPSRRLGNIHRETENIRSHPWLSKTDWNAIEARAAPGPIIPPLRSAGDTANFEVTDGSAERLPPQPDVELPPDVQKFFDGF